MSTVKIYLHNSVQDFAWTARSNVPQFEDWLAALADDALFNARSTDVTRLVTSLRSRLMYVHMLRPDSRFHGPYLAATSLRNVMASVSDACRLTCAICGQTFLGSLTHWFLRAQITENDQPFELWNAAFDAALLSIDEVIDFVTGKHCSTLQLRDSLSDLREALNVLYSLYLASLAPVANWSELAIYSDTQAFVYYLNCGPTARRYSWIHRNSVQSVKVASGIRLPDIDLTVDVS